jgi:hypothetical protein
MVTFQAMLDEADDLYGLPLDEFTKARDALAKRLRGEQRRDDADLVKGLKRPSVAAGAINLAVRRHGADDLLAAGEELRDAHGALLDGKGDAASVREATERERAAVREFAKLALGDDATEATAEKVRATLHAAAVDDEVREQLEAGRLEREAEAGVDPMALMASAAAKKGGAKGGTKAASARGKSTSGSSARGKSAAKAPSGRGKTAAKKAGKSDAERRREEAAARAVAKAEEAVAAADEAEERADAAREALAEAEEAARKSRAVVEELEATERQARRAVKEAEADSERRRTEARRAVKAADAKS